MRRLRLSKNQSPDWRASATPGRRLALHASPFAGSGPNINIAPPGRGLFFCNAFGRCLFGGFTPAACPPPAAEEKFFAVCGSLLLFAAHGETVRTDVAVLGVHVGTVEAQVRPVHARPRVRRTAPGVTALAHNVQIAGIAGAATRSGVEVSSARSAKYKLRLLLRSLNRTLACALDTPARQCPNKFGIALA